MSAQHSGPALSERILEIRRDTVSPEKWFDYRAAESGAAANCESKGRENPAHAHRCQGEPEAWRITTWKRFGVIETVTQRYRGPQRTNRNQPRRMRYFSISIVEVRPGKASDFEEVRRASASG